MTDAKMTIEEAREIVKNGSWTEYHISNAEYFINGWESRQTEVDELKKKIEKVREDINWMLNNKKLLNPIVFEYLEKTNDRG